MCKLPYLGSPSRSGRPWLPSESDDMSRETWYPSSSYTIWTHDPDLECFTGVWILPFTLCYYPLYVRQPGPSGISETISISNQRTGTLLRTLPSTYRTIDLQTLNLSPPGFKSRSEIPKWLMYRNPFNELYNFENKEVGLYQCYTWIYVCRYVCICVCMKYSIDTSHLLCYRNFLNRPRDWVLLFC